MHTIRALLVSLLLVGGLVRLATVCAPERASLPVPMQAHSEPCALGTSC
jgi:hypothetical protein